VTNVNFENVKKISDGSNVDYTNNKFYNFDEHFSGLFPSMLGASFAQSALMACVYEFIQSIGPSMFNNTVIHLAQEFGRLPDDTMGGTQHEFIGGHTIALNGEIQKPIVVGNTYQTYAPDWGAHVIRATWGTGAPTRVDGSLRYLGIGHSVSSISHLLGVSSPTPNDSSLVLRTGSTVIPTIDPASTSGDPTS
jgi:hypothetical protein